MSRGSFWSGLLAVSLFVPSISFAAGGKEDFPYPELLVTPRASQRLDIEAKKEAKGGISTHLPIMGSSAITFAAALFHFAGKDPNKDRQGSTPFIGAGIGGAWLAGGLLLAGYRPYSNALEEINAMPAKTEREQLIRERYAEEAIERARGLGQRLKWISVISNTVACAVMVGTAQTDALSKPIAGVGMATAFLPLIFPYKWVEVADQQRDYKKKIYGPVASAGFIGGNASSAPVPGILLSLNF